MSLSNIPEYRIFLAASVIRKGAPRAEITSYGRVDRARDFTGKDDPVPRAISLGVWNGRSGDQCLRIWM
jgi:hypothetical protein